MTATHQPSTGSEQGDGVLRPPAATRDADRVPEGARVLAVVCEAWPEQSQREVLEWIQGRLAPLQPREIRDKQLWLLVEMIRYSGDLPTAEDYDEEAHRRRAQGGTVANRTTLRRIVGGDWNAVLMRAVELAVQGSASRSKTRKFGRAQIPPKYTYTDKVGQVLGAGARGYEKQDLIARGIIWARDVLGRWPDLDQYLEFGRVQRLLADRTGEAEPMIATKKPLKDVFITYPQALAYAKQRATQLREDHLGVRVRLHVGKVEE